MKHRGLVLVVVAIVGFAAWRWRGGGGASEAAHDDKLLLDRIWIDHVPKNDRDTINVFLALDEDSVGVFQASSNWRGAYELFRFEASGDDLRVVFPQTGDRERVRARARKCDEGIMDYCLELAGSSRGVKRYYSRKGWEIDGRDAAAASARADALVHQLAAAAPSE